LIEWGVAARTFPGESRSGDMYVVEPFPGGALVAAVDGLGHGDEAAEAAETAARILAAHPAEPPQTLVRRCHEGLKSTRGAAMSLASFNAGSGTISWLGVGNVEVLLLRSDPSSRSMRESLALRGGVVGYRLPRLVESVVPVRSGDLLILTTDGIAGDSFVGLRAFDPPESIANSILDRFARGTDDALALVARYRGSS